MSERETWDNTSALQRETHQSPHDSNKHDIVRHCALNFDFVFVVVHLNCVFTWAYMELNQFRGIIV